MKNRQDLPVKGPWKHTGVEFLARGVCNKCHRRVDQLNGCAVPDTLAANNG